MEIGTPLPSLSVTLDDSTVIRLDEAGKTGYTLVYFYPKADTPGCTAQACSLRDAYEPLSAQGVKVFGVSKDSVKSQSQFRQKYKLPFPLVADTEGLLVKAFGVPAGLGFPKRQAFLFKDGVLVWQDLNASTSKQADDVLAFLRVSSAQ